MPNESRNWDGAPNSDPQGLSTRSHSEYGEGGTLADMIREDLVAERIAIDAYGEMIRYLGTDDPTSRRVLKEILEKRKSTRKISKP